MTDSLTDRVKKTIGPNMLLGLQDAELHDEPGAERIREWVDWIANAIAPLIDAEVQAQLERIRAAVTEGKHFGKRITALTASDVMVAHEITRKQMCAALDAGLHLNWPQIVEAAQRSRNANTAWMADVQRVKDATEAGPPSGTAIPGEWESGWDAAMDAVRNALENKEPTCEP